MNESDNFLDSVSRKFKDGELSRTVRVISCGMAFDFDMLKLTIMFPQNILQSLIKNNVNPERSDDGVAILRLNTDVQSMRIIYSYYNTLTLILPESKIDKELLLNTCDYFGFIEITKHIDKLFSDEENIYKNTIDEIIQKEECPSTLPNCLIDNTPEIIDENYISIKRCEVVKEEKEKQKELYIINPKCALSSLDKSILMQETSLRKAYAIGERPKIPRINFLETDTSPQFLDHPYTLVVSDKKQEWSWVTSNEEFVENLKLYSFGILDESMPSCLVVAGSSALRCAMKLSEIIPAKIIKTMSKFYSPRNNDENDENDDEYVVFTKIQHQQTQETKYTKDQLILLSKMVHMHSKTLYHYLMTCTNRRNRPADIFNAMKNLNSKKSNMSNDIDLFITSEDPETIFKAISFIHNKMCEKFEKVDIIRTEHAITFYPKSRLSVPSIQIILRAYDSIEHILLGFDIDSCCIGYDGKQIICSQRFLRAIKYGYNLIDLTRLSVTYELRLMKYYKRGFDIAMIEPNIKEQTEKVLLIINKLGSIYPILRGIYKLSYFLIYYHKLAKVPKILEYNSSDYSSKSLITIMNIMRSGIEKFDFVYGTDLNEVLFNGVTKIEDINNLPRQERRKMRKIEENTTLPPLRIMRRNVTKQTESDELFTGSFNPVQLAWYEGAIII